MSSFFTLFIRYLCVCLECFFRNPTQSLPFCGKNLLVEKKQFYTTFLLCISDNIPASVWYFHCFAIFTYTTPPPFQSWFPGYSWTITNCSICNSHLGWKFLKVKRRHSHRSSDPNATDESTRGEHNEEDRDRPNMFWGLSNASVTTESTSPQRVLHGRFQLQDWLFLQAAAQQRNNDNWG
uniref:CULT domain-containing protein n=1 Tax=Ditylum brightwellii TaxID=49249 RepID=A0A7S4V7T0_9STRA